MNTPIPIHPKNPEMRKLRPIIDALRDGAVIAYPTDTTYALGCDMFNKKAVEQIYQMKEMQKQHPLTLLCHSMAELAKYVVMDNPTYRMVKHLLPGPYTCIFTASREVPKTLLPKRKEIGIRVQNTPILQAMLHELGHPMLSTTASNALKEVLDDPLDIIKEYPKIAFVIDAGPCGIIPSTVIDFSQTPPVLLRQGIGPIDFL